MPANGRHDRKNAFKNIVKRGMCKVQDMSRFDSYDIWETPYISQTLASKILQEYTPKQEFIKKENHFLFKMDKEQNADLYYCPMLDNEKGCILGDDKPFDCRIYFAESNGTE